MATAQNGTKAANTQDLYESPLASRYCRNSELLEIFSERNKTHTWRQLWLWLAQAEMELGLPMITPDKLTSMRDNLDNIDWSFVKTEEKRVRHDVMAHIRAFEKVCPQAAGIIHLGATSAFVQDNTDLILMRDALDRVLIPRVAICLNRLAKFAEKNKSVAIVGRTHYQAASLTTVGKRACIWAQDILVAFKQLVHFRSTELRFRGVKGATGTLDSFLTLFDDDIDKVTQLNHRVTELAGFARQDGNGSFLVTGQTYSRMLDAVFLNALALLGAAVHKMCMDLRMLQDYGELQEPFESSQIGSSAMPYKRNPMRAERCCAFARYLKNLPGNALDTAAIAGFERTLDDSANRRLVLPEACLTTEALLNTLQNIIEGLSVNAETVDAHVRSELPFLSLERVLMELTKKGVSRQEGHEKIRQIALDAQDRRKRGEPVDLQQILRNDPFFLPIKDKISGLGEDPMKIIGACPFQVEQFLQKELLLAIKEYCNPQDQSKAELTV